MASQYDFSIEYESMAAQRSIVATRINARMTELGLNAQQVSLLMGAHKSYISELLRGKFRDPGSSKLQAVADVLQCTVDYLKGATDNPDATGPLQNQISIDVVGFAEAGAFRQVAPMSKIGTVSSDRSRDYPNSQHFALLVRDNSMNASKYPLVEGMYALGVYLDKSNIPIQDRRLYAIRLSDNGGRTYETTIKRAREFTDHWEFHSESTNAVHRDSKIVVQKRATEHNGTKVIVVGLIYAAKIDFEM
jgi:transcriptional regulator with XRE-family HTH domain